MKKAERVLSNDFQFESLPECTDPPKQTKESCLRMWGNARFPRGAKLECISDRETTFRPRLIARCPRPLDDLSRSDRSAGEISSYAFVLYTEPLCYLGPTQATGVVSTVTSPGPHSSLFSSQITYMHIAPNWWRETSVWSNHRIGCR